MIKYKLLLVVLVAHHDHESNDEVFIKVGIKPGRDPEFAEGKNVILSTTCRLGGIIMVRRSFCRAGRLIDYDDEDDEEMSITTTSK